MLSTLDLSEQLKADKYFLNGIQDEGCLTNIHIKHDSFYINDVDLALDEFKHMRHVIKVNNKDPMQSVKGPLSFTAGNVTVFVVNSAGSHLISFFNPNKSKKSASKKQVNAAFGQLKVKKILPSQQKKANLKSSFEEDKPKADVISSIKNSQKK